MANRRCISCKMILSPKFQRMTPSAKALYSAMIAMADDDGVVEAESALFVTGLRKSALKELIKYGYVAMINERDCIAWVVGWQSFNTIDVRYGTASYYRDSLKRQFPNVKLLDLKGFDGIIPTSTTSEIEENKREEKRTQSQGNHKRVEEEEEQEVYFGCAYNKSDLPFQ